MLDTAEATNAAAEVTAKAASSLQEGLDRLTKEPTCSPKQVDVVPYWYQDFDWFCNSFGSLSFRIWIHGLSIGD